jgi:hypothetical protein
MATGAAFYHETNVTQRVESGARGGYVLIGQLDLEPGEYLVWGKFSVGANASSSYPGPPWPYGGGHALLAYADGHDSTYVSIEPESGSNNETVALQTAGKTNLRRKARLYFFNPFPLPVFVNVVRMAALQLDSLATSIVGETTDMVPEDPSDRIRNQMLRAVYDTKDVAVHLKGG